MQIAGYRIENRVGKGGMAMVYRALQESLGRYVALKVLNPVHSETEEFSARFLNEGRILAALSHSHIITIHDIGISDGLHYIAMEFVDGGDLRSRIQAGVDPDTALAYAEAIGRALQHAHDHGIVHRDVKPANILFRRDGTLLLTDFGIAKQLGSGGDLTLTGTTLGSPHYLSPEQAQSRPVDGRSDIYSVGIMLFEMLARRKPYAGESEIDTIIRHLKDPTPRLPGDNKRYQPLLDRMMAKHADDRFQSAAEMVAAIRELRGLPPEKPAPPPPPPGPAAEPDTDLNEAAVVTADVALPGVREEIVTLVNQSAGRVPPAAGGRAGPVWWTLMIAGLGVIFAGSAYLYLAPGPAPPPASARAPERPAPAAPAPGPGPAPLSAQAPAEPTPAEAPAPPPAAPPTVEELLTAADQALEDFRLRTPAGDSAEHYFREALARDPDSAAARAGLSRIGERYAVLARAKMAEQEPRRAEQFVRLGLEVAPRHPELLALREALARPPEPVITESPAPEPKVAAVPEPGDGEIRGEHPTQLFRRIKGWFD